MEEKKILSKIKSSHVLITISNYIKDIKVVMKLFNYSKYFQKKVRLNLYDYQEKYYDKLGININKYLTFFNNERNDNFDKDFLYKKLEDDLIKYKIDKNIFETFVQKYFKKYKSNIIKENSDNFRKIDIYSPFFDLLSKNKLFEQIFYIPISINEIEKSNIKNDYISAFDKLNNLNTKYEGISFNFKYSNDIDFLKELKINFSQIKMLSIRQEYQTFDNDYNCFFKTLFSFFIDKKKLIVLELDLLKNKSNSIIPQNFEDLNNFESLKQLNICGINFQTNFTLKLFNLKKLKISYCSKISFDENSCLNLKQLNIFYSEIIKNEKLLKLPEIEECYLENSNTPLKQQQYNLILDLSNSTKLNTLKIDINNFIKLENKFIQNLYLFTPISSIELEKKMFVKIFSLNNLKKLQLSLNNITDDDIEEIEGDNLSITDLTIFWNNNDDCILYNLQKKFPNLDKLSIFFPYSSNIETLLEFVRNENNKIKEISLGGGGNYNIKVYCQSFQNLERIEINLGKIKNLKEALPIFNNCEKEEFNNLKYFRFISRNENEITMNILKNIYNNISKINNLKVFELECITTDIDENFYSKFKEKISSLKLDYSRLIINKRKMN